MSKSDSIDNYPRFKKVLDMIKYGVDDVSEDKCLDPDAFDHDLSEHLISLVRDGSDRECHLCDKPQSTFTCAACKWCLYCSKDCQRKHWKINHKGVCNDFRDNRKDGSDLAECFRACCAISEEDYIFYTDLRWRLFLVQSKNIEYVSISTSVIYLMGEVRHVASIGYFDIQREKVQQIHRFIMKPVDSGEVAKSNIQFGSGRLSQEARAKVVDNLVKFIEEILSSGLIVQSITFGRGLVGLCDDKDLANRR